MSITIERIVDRADDRVRALADHSGQKLDVDVAGSLSQIESALGKSLTVELDYAAVVNWRILEADIEDHHGLFQAHGLPRCVRIVGRAHNILPLEDGKKILDVYTRAGPEFVTFDSAQISGPEPKVDEPIEATVRDLCFYPTWY